MSPYVLAGFGQQDLDYTMGTTKVSTTDTVMNLGGGVLYGLSDVLSLRAELRGIHNSDKSLMDYLVLTGLQYNLGGKPEEVPQYVAPVEPVNVVPADTDGDGVVDANDRCPNTPAGWEVSVDGCPLDTDRDRVPNSIDECPNTPTVASRCEWLPIRSRGSFGRKTGQTGINDAARYDVSSTA